MGKILTTSFSFFLGILAIWIKEWIAQGITIRRKKKALRELYVSEINAFPKYIHILEQSKTEKFGIKSKIHMPEAIVELLSDLVKSDLSNAHFYNKMMANQSIARDLI